MSLQHMCLSVVNVPQHVSLPDLMTSTHAASGAAGKCNLLVVDNVHQPETCTICRRTRQLVLIEQLLWTLQV